MNRSWPTDDGVGGGGVEVHGKRKEDLCVKSRNR